MRYIRLINGDGNVLDVTTTVLFLHNLNGFGYELEESYWRIDEDFRVLNSQLKQKEIEGTIIFNDDSPYRSYQDFMQFIYNQPIYIEYRPYSNCEAYRKKVSLTSIGKTELDTYGVLRVPIKAISLSPWFISFEIKSYADNFEFV